MSGCPAWADFLGNLGGAAVVLVRFLDAGAEVINTSPGRAAIMGHLLIRESPVTCSTCQASCCRLEVMLITDTGVPEHLVETDEWGGLTMARLDDGWCAALDRDTLKCSIYSRRPWICREFEMGADECRAEKNT